MSPAPVELLLFLLNGIVTYYSKAGNKKSAFFIFFTTAFLHFQTEERYRKRKNGLFINSIFSHRM